MPRSFAAWALAAVLVGPVCAAEPAEFYCYVPDVASGVVYQSQALPVGPIAERSSYGREFAQFLRSTHRVSAELTGYCVMGSNAEIARARAALSSEPCPECGGATRFEPVQWPHAARVATSGEPVIAARPKQPLPEPSSPPARASMLVVMGNSETGKLLVVSNAPDTKSVEAQARMIRATGWKSLLATSETGYGAAFCVRHGGEVRFFLAHAQPSIKDAIAQAREFSRPYGAETGEPARICGSPWRAQGGSDTPPDDNVIDGFKDAIQDEYACDRQPGGDSSRSCPPRNLSGTGVRG